MRIYYSAFFLFFLAGFLQAQTSPYSEPFLLASPGVVTRMEKFEPFNPPGNWGGTLQFAADRNGFLWCVTLEGVARFDGYELKIYPENLADTAGVFRAQMQAIAVDGDGFVWAGTPEGGLKRLDPVTGQSRWYRGRPEDSTSIGTGATRLLVTSDGQLWAGAKYGLARYNRGTDSFIRYNLPPDCPKVREGVMPAGYIITSLCELDRSIWVGLIGGGLAEFNRDTGVWKRYMPDPSTGAGPGQDIVRAVCADRSGRLWIGTRNYGLDRFDPRSGTWAHFSVSKTEISPYKNNTIPVPSVPVVAIVEDHCGGLWISAIWAGLYRLDPETGKVLHFLPDSTDASSLLYNSISWIGATRSRQEGELGPGHHQHGNTMVWVPYGSEGAHRVIVRKDPCTSVVIRREAGRIPHVVAALSRDSSGSIWGGVFNGSIGLFDLETGMVRWYPAPQSGIVSLCQLRDRTVLVSTRSLEAWMYVARRDTLVRFLPDLRIHRFFEDGDSLLWVGCSSRKGMSFIAAIDRRTGRCSVHPRQDPDSANHRDESVTAMCGDDRGGLWYGTRGGGLIRFDMKLKTYLRYAGVPGSDNALIANAVTALIPESAGRLWVGTRAGLTLMDCDRGTFDHMHSSLQEKRELHIRDMVDDGEGHLWIAADEGALCFTKATRTIRRIVPPPASFDVFCWSAMFVPQTRTVTFGGVSGFFTFPIDDPPPASPPPPVVLTSFRVFEKPYPLNADIWSLKSITLPHSASFFSFTFAALDYVKPAENRYAYRLEGLDPEWVQAGSRRYASYTNLDPGRYVFRVRGANSEGIWNEKGTVLEIVVLPPWYRTTWAYGAYLLAFGGFLYLLRTFDRRRAALKHSLEMKSFEAAKMHEVDQMKSRFFANISHEFRTPLTLILGPIEQLAERFTNDEQIQSTVSAMRRNGLRLLQLINQLLNLSRMDAGKMTLRIHPLDLVALSRSLVMSFLSLAERKKIDLIFDPEESEIIAYTDRDKFEKILTNLVSNAFKFTGEGGEVKVVLRIVSGKQGEQDLSSVRGGRVEVVVSDTGIGIEPAHIGKVFDRFYQVESSQTQEHGGTGIGLALAKELVEILKGEITVVSTPGHGSTFVVRLPLGKEAWRPEEIGTEEVISDSVVKDSPAAVLAEGQPSHVQETPQDPGKPVVLIVEDKADVRTYARGFLQKHYTVEEAENGEAGLQKAREMNIDLVISDIMMPVMDGVQLCRELKADDRTNHIPVVLLTARATLEGKLEGLDIGADDYVAKPFDARELIARVKNLIDTRRRLREKYHRQVTLGPANTPVTSTDEQFLRRLGEYIERHIADTDYDTEGLAHDMCMSRMQLNRKLNALTGRSTHEVVREFRLQRAAELLRGHADNITGVAYDVGFSSLSHFAHAFRERFGVVPSEYRGSQPLKVAPEQRHRSN